MKAIISKLSVLFLLMSFTFSMTSCHDDEEACNDPVFDNTVWREEINIAIDREYVIAYTFSNKYVTELSIDKKTNQIINVDARYIYKYNRTESSIDFYNIKTKERIKGRRLKYREGHLTDGETDFYLY